VLPQFSLHGFSMGRTSADWVNAATRIPGPETERFGELARELQVWIAGTLCEVLDEFPGRYFLTGFIVAPSGDVVLRYRKLYAFSTKTRPGDVLTRYLGLFGREALFPVVRTPLGRIGMAIAGDVNWPEMTRALALRGAEIILNPTAQALMPADRDTGIPYVRRVRAFENLCYMILANAGPLTGAGPMPAARLPSEIVDFQGRVVAVADTNEATTVTGTLDVEALRRERALPMKNFLAQLQPAPLTTPPRGSGRQMAGSTRRSRIRWSCSAWSSASGRKWWLQVASRLRRAEPAPQRAWRSCTSS
jgi:predicted amidohydrolase